jgi:hypothetical protein
MRQRTIRQGVCVAGALALAAITLDYMTNGAGVQAQVAREPIPPASIGPAPVDDLQSATAQTAAIVDGIVTDIQYDYSEQDGPWTTVILSKARAIAGSAPDTIAIRHFGGPLPNGGLMVAAELPVFVRDKEYIVFLRNTEWNVSAVVGDLAFRVDTVDDTEVLVDSDGAPVLQVGAFGFELGTPVFEGPTRDGSAPKPIEGGLKTLAGRTPLDLATFAKSLQANLDAQGLRIAGNFFEKPAGGFNWRGQQAAPTPGAIPDKGGDLTIEADASELKR